MEETKEFKGIIKKGISSLAFSPSGNKLIAVAIDDYHHMALIEVKTGAFQTFKGGRELILSCVFKDDNVN